ncbi:MAG: formylglycine-generating enzyme family protein [Treponema sp.]|nr:formylglycine-generating enzyme family protein [Treponema sp.]
MFLGLILFAVAYALAFAGCIVTGESGEMKSLIETMPVQGGSFMYGRNGSTGGTLEKVSSFRMGKYPVTQRQWEAVMDDNPSIFNGTNKLGDASYVTADETFVRGSLPVEMVNWYNILKFANKLSIKEDLLPVYEIKGSTDPDDWGDVPLADNEEWNAVKVRKVADGWRLPTELQWEFAAKGGTKSAGYEGKESDKYFVYPGSDDADEVAWYDNNSDGRTHEVGKKKPNELGLYDMGGNVYEQCFDPYNPNSANADRILRGGSWSTSAGSARSVSQLIGSPSGRSGSFGFRLVRP